MSIRQKILTYLLPDTWRRDLTPGPERDPKFREYLERAARSGLQTLAIVEIGAPIAMAFGRLATGGGARVWEAVAMESVGALTFATASLPWSRRHARLLTSQSAWAATAALGWASLRKPGGALAVDDYILAAVTLVIVTAAAAAALKPWHVLALGAAVEGMYIFSAWAGGQWGFPSAAVHIWAHGMFLFMLTLLAAGIAATNYAHRRAEFESAQGAVRVAEALTGAQLRAQLAENAISIGKMAAALSHELNSPIGALRSSIATLLSLDDRHEKVRDESPELEGMRGELRRSIDESAARIDDVISRLRRFVKLEEEDMKPADLNELLTDVALLHQHELQAAGVAVEFDLEDSLPALTCRPQLLSAVFSSLLTNAVQAVNSNGRIAIVTRRADSTVEVTVRDNGRGMRPEEAEGIFDPSFKVSGHRISSGNWSLFNSRQIVYEHGGEIAVETGQGQGTAVHISLPLGKPGS